MNDKASIPKMEEARRMMKKGQDQKSLNLALDALLQELTSLQNLLTSLRLENHSFLK